MADASELELNSLMWQAIERMLQWARDPERKDETWQFEIYPLLEHIERKMLTRRDNGG